MLESFEREASPAGAWPPLADATRKQRAKKGYGGAGPILERGGDLIASITRDWDDRSAEAGTNLRYAATHQFGDNRSVSVPAHERKGKPVSAYTISNRNIPAHPFLNIWPEHERMIVDDLARLITSEWG